ncbi:MAG: beta-L-arabinofuranosidase domain-containing protein, partial [Pseudomonadota bacterium]|nr:beta-L-arabinofuranosidase domain-containing protein [Pseudomonadota bacterium]
MVTNKIVSTFNTADLGRSHFEGWLADRMMLNIEKRLLTLDLDMILDPFEHRPGQQWWAGEHAGKHLHAATLAWLYAGDDRLKARMSETAARLIATQLPNGYLGTYKDSDQFRQGDGLGWDGPVWDVWTHKYCLIGLLTYYQATRDQSAIDACRQAADLMYENYVTKGKSLRLASAHLGMAATSLLEPMTILYQETSEPR